MLFKLPKNDCTNFHIEIINGFNAILNNNEYIKLIEPIYYDDDEKDYLPVSDLVPIKDIDEARYLIDIYKYKKETLYWKLSIYNLNSEINEYGFRYREYSCLLTNDGTITYLDDLSSSIPDFNIPVPYKMGNILKVDCRPYVKDIKYCVLTEVGDDCCGTQCAYLDGDNNIKTGAFKHGNFYDGSPIIYMSPLYNCEKIRKDELPIDQKPLLEIFIELNKKREEYIDNLERYSKEEKEAIKRITKDDFDVYIPKMNIKTGRTCLPKEWFYDWSC